ncbi:MAG: hypothetical protein ACD_3C00085G0001 [uncultured bacterium (gcode 4)]|uniref:Uncharacterized protein n=1 Tax=uncultured bacterium (gcode 4) TaxID=1234023 RepID=K2G1W0_9BACT|nr:MAG: hypothetical protein ACD_3C00085G0001 [uncultured bacterium (gcode 4)]
MISVVSRAIFARVETFTAVYLTWFNAVKPLILGILMNKGDCPHSKDGLYFEPFLAFWPLHPFPQKVPLPEEFPRPSLFEVFLDHSSAFMLVRVTIIFLNY